MILGITYIENFIDKPDELFELLIASVSWDERMSARKMASFGKAYNYSQMDYPFQEFLPEVKQINNKLNFTIGFMPNNCLINYYLDGRSKMGYHSDQTDILETDTGIAIVSLGETRILKFRNIANPEHFLTYELPSGCLFYMTQEVQANWQHAIPKSDTDNGRISLTFRKIK
jgi:alkylated DNA repair dioxygenase AlkB